MAVNLTAYGFLDNYNVLQTVKPLNHNNLPKNKSDILIGDDPTGTHQ
jgi:hypothetical protein